MASARPGAACILLLASCLILSAAVALPSPLRHSGKSLRQRDTAALPAGQHPSRDRQIPRVQAAVTGDDEEDEVGAEHDEINAVIGKPQQHPHPREAAEDKTAFAAPLGRKGGRLTHGGRGGSDALPASIHDALGSSMPAFGASSAGEASADDSTIRFLERHPGHEGELGAPVKEREVAPISQHDDELAIFNNDKGARGPRRHAGASSGMHISLSKEELELLGAMQGTLDRDRALVLEHIKSLARTQDQTPGSLAAPEGGAPNKAHAVSKEDLKLLDEMQGTASASAAAA